MIVKKFEAPTETEAVIKAQQELGPHAIVLNVKTIKQRGIMRVFKKDSVEITAALEEKEFVQEINERKPVAKTSEKHIDLKANEQININVVPEEFEKRLDSLSEMLITQMKENNEELIENKVRSTVNAGNVSSTELKNDISEHEEAEDPRKAAMNNNLKTLRLIYNKLIDNEVDEKYANMLINEIESSLKKESNVDSILAGVYQKIILKLGEPEGIEVGDKQKVVFFIGPTGVGKTTTIAKIASKFKINEHKSVALITSDTYRIAAVEQLNTYANILDVPIKVVYTEDEIKKAMEEFRNYDLILVDTAGRSHKNTEQKDSVINLYNLTRKDDDSVDWEAYLVLSATTKYRDLVNIVKAYETLGEYKLLFTKLDETGTLGNILNMKLMTGARLSYTTTGQNVPDDIETVNVQKLAKQLLGGNV